MCSSRVLLPGLAVHHGALLGEGDTHPRHLLEHRVTSPSSAVSRSGLSLGEMWDTGSVGFCPGGTEYAGPAAAHHGGSWQPQLGRFPKLGHIQTAQQRDFLTCGGWQGQVAEGLWWLCPHFSLTSRSGNSLQLPELRFSVLASAPPNSLMVIVLCEPREASDWGMVLHCSHCSWAVTPLLAS